MKTKMWVLGAAAAAAMAAGCAGSQKARSEAKAEDEAAAEKQVAGPAPEYGTFGVDLEGMDTTQAPGNDWFAYVNGNWTKNTEIPADKARYSMFNVLTDRAQEQNRAIIEEAAASNAAEGEVAQKVGDYFAAFMDEAQIESLGTQPLEPYLAKIDGVTSKQELAKLFGEFARTYIPGPVGGYISADAKAPDTYAVYLYQSGLGLPNRDFYLEDKPEFAAIREAYVDYATKMLVLTGVPEADAKKKAQGILKLETEIAKVHWTNVESRDANKRYNPWKAADFAKKAPGFDWKAYFAAAGLGEQETFIVSQPSAFTGIAALVGKTPLATWKDWSRLHTTSNLAALLPKAFDDTHFAFYGTVLGGQPEQQARWKRGVDAVSASLGEAVGRLYVEKHFPPEAKQAADEMVQNIIAAMDARIENLSWMSDETKAKAKEKLASFRPKIGYPDTWRDYSALVIKRDDALGNGERAAAFEYARDLAKLGGPVDRDEWLMPPMVVNAYAMPTMNEIVFPAAILQPPFFDPHADDAVNYGGIGAVIGHEITHHFDDQGRKYDKHGKLADWWTAEDVEAFKKHADALVKQYGEYEPLPGMHVNGELTLGENIADLAGLLIAHDAYRRSLDGKPAPVIDGFTGDQRFYMGHAQLWRSKYREPALRQQLVVDPHTAGHFRPYVVRNIDAWYEAFDVKPEDAHYLAPEERVRIW
ncbi:MAG TPA: M13 family metallopeptidase [Myxococcaceae bacterium]|nr:M13 family metallopeptidase [Myxococcaceae bacterium]